MTNSPLSPFCSPLDRRALLLWSSSSLALSMVGCGGSSGGTAQSAPPPRKGAPRSKYTGPLVSPEKIQGDFMWEQRVTAVHEFKRGGFDAVIQKKGPELTVLGLTPMKTRGFSLKQRGQEFEYEQFVPFDLPFSPEAVLFDIHRAFFFELLHEFPESESRRLEWEGETLTDEFAGGRLHRRTFENVAGSGMNLLISYSPPGYAKGKPPELTNLENQAFNYVLRVETTAARAI